MDLYVLATPYRVTWDYFFGSREHTFEWEGKAEYELVKNRGVSIFLMKAGMLGTFPALGDVFPLFTDTGCGEDSNIDLLKRHTRATFEARPQPWITNISLDDIHSGDFLVISKIQGRWGGFETLDKWVRGASAGHSVVCLKDSDGKLWVGESGSEKQGEEVIALVPWDEWRDFELHKDAFNPHIALLPLHLDIRAKFNETAAWEYAQSMVGKSYGFHKMIFSWIDTVNGNCPPPSNAHMRLPLPEILVETGKRGYHFDKLQTIPERDDWIYSNGKWGYCVGFVLAVYKPAGLFDPISSSVQVTEFTNNSSRLPKWCNDGDKVKLPYCKIKGKYQIELPGFNTMQPYPHMNERCPSLPPVYSRSQNC